jgi:hypothetical protein
MCSLKNMSTSAERPILSGNKGYLAGGDKTVTFDASWATNEKDDPTITTRKTSVPRPMSV